MLPLPIQFSLAMVAHAMNDRMARRIEYLLEEVRVLREIYTETTGRKRIPFTVSTRAPARRTRARSRLRSAGTTTITSPKPAERTSLVLGPELRRTRTVANTGVQRFVRLRV